MPTITENDIEPSSIRFARFGSEHTPAVPLVFGELSQDSPERYRSALADAIFGGVTTGEGA